MVPTFTWGLSRSNLALATLVLLLLQWVSLVCGRTRESIVFPSAGDAGRLGRLELPDELLGDVRRHLVVALELHGVGSAALGCGPYVGRVAEHLGQRDIRRYDLRVTALLHPGHMTATAVEIADHVAHELLGRHDLDAEDRLEQHGLGPRGCLLESQRAGHLEGDLRGVGVVVLA